MSCAQIATIPMNSVSDASAAASSTKTFSITASFTLNSNLEHSENIVLILFYGQEAGSGRRGKQRLKNVGWLIGLAGSVTGRDGRLSCPKMSSSDR